MMTVVLIKMAINIDDTSVCRLIVRFWLRKKKILCDRIGEKGTVGEA
jgi:hypothetical protein